MRGEQRLVRGDDIGARPEREKDLRAGGLDAAHQLDHDVGADDELLGIRRQQLARQLGVARRGGVAHGDADEIERGTGAVGQFVAVAQQQVGDLRAHGARAEQSHAQTSVIGHAEASGVGRCTPRSRASRSSMVSPRTITRASPPETATTGGRGA